MEVAAGFAEFLLGEADAHAFVRDEDGLVVAGGEFAFDEAVAFLDLDGDDAAFTDVFEIREIRFFDDGAFVRDEVFDSEFALLGHDLRAARGGVFFLDLAEFVFDDGEDALLIRDFDEDRNSVTNYTIYIRNLDIIKSAR